MQTSGRRRAFLKLAGTAGLGSALAGMPVPALPRERAAKRMKVTRVEPMLLDRFLIVRVTTDAGITGIGEAGSHRFVETAKTAVEYFSRYLVGKDPLEIEHHWQYLFRLSHFRGAIKMAAISALDIALWDIAGKYFDVPVYKLLGGPTRDRCRAYYWVRGDTKEKLVQGCVDAKNKGYTAVGHLTPFLDDPREKRYFKTYADKIDDAADTVRRYREAVGEDVDLCLEIHRRLNAAEAIALAREIEPYRPYFYEDPVPPHNLDTLAEVARKVNIPIATGERYNSSHDFAMILKRDAAQYLRTSVALCGGISGARKIAGMAEAFDRHIVPHTPLSPVSTAACVQVDASVENFAIQELPDDEDRYPKNAIVKQPLAVEKGFILVPDAPCIGIELADDSVEKVPMVPRYVISRQHADGSIVDH